MKKRYLISETGYIIGYEEKGIVYMRVGTNDKFLHHAYSFEDYINLGFKEITEAEFFLEMI